MSASTDCLDDAAIAALADGESAARDALAHLEACEACRELVSAACACRTGADPVRAPRLGPGTVLGRHRIERPLGSGGMGVVYLARDVELDRRVAIKLLRGHDHDRLVRESQALARLNHPNVVTAHEVGRHDGATYLIMEHVDGGTVRDWLAEAPRSPAEIARLYAQCARGVAAAHAAGLVHRDIKPDNLLVGRDGRARVSDFGLAIAGDGATFAGTPRYMAPEVLAGTCADARSDQWSLCASLWESLYGTPPFAGTTRDELLAAMAQGDPDPADEPVPPRWLRRTLTRGLARDPDARFASADALAEALAPSPRSFRRSVTLVIASATLAAGVGAAIGARPPEPACQSQLGDVWNDAKRISLGIGDVAASAITVYANRWSQQRLEVCRLERSDPAQRVPALRAACLDVRRRALVTLVEVLSTADAETVRHASAAVANLPALEDCTAAERLAGRQPRPSEPTKLAELVDLERRFAAARVLSDLGKRREQIGELLAVAERAATLDYHPLAADALDTAGRALHELSDPQGLPTLRRALWSAQTGGDDRQLADVAIALVGAAAERPITERDELRAQARAAVARLRWRHDPGALAARSMLATAEGNDDLARGDIDAGERQLREAIELGVKAYGPRSKRLTIARLDLAKVLEPTQADKAALVIAAAIDIDDPIETAEHVAALLDAGWKLHDVGRDTQALEFVHKGRRLPTRSKFAALLLDDLESEVALSLGDLATARMTNARALAALGPTPIPQHAASSWITHAGIVEASGDPATAVDEYRKAIGYLDRDPEARQYGVLGLARALARLGQDTEARALIETEVTAGIFQKRAVPPMLRLLAELRWRAGDREGARRAARDGRAAAENLPALVDERRMLDAWLAAH